jgi:crossover junction endodeoxyribonuclease RuvC
VLGVDPGSIKMGYGCIDVAPGCRLTYVEAGVLVAPDKMDKYARLVELGRDLEAVIAELRPDVVALEAGFVKGQQGALVSGAARGVAAYVAGRAGLQVVEYAPATVKKAASGHGAAGKDQVARIVAMRLRMVREPDPDAADALAIAITRAQDRAAGWVERPRAVAG